MEIHDSDPRGRPPGPHHLGIREVAALRMLAGYSGPARDGVRSVVERLSAYARAVAAELLGTSEGESAQARADAAWFRADAAKGAAMPAFLSRGRGPAAGRRRIVPRPRREEG